MKRDTKETVSRDPDTPRIRVGTRNGGAVPWEGSVGAYLPNVSTDGATKRTPTEAEDHLTKLERLYEEEAYQEFLYRTAE